MKMINSMALVGLFAFTNGIATAKNTYGVIPEVAGRYEINDSIGDDNRSVIIRIPKNAKKKMPLILLLHGWTGFAGDIERYSGFGPMSDKEGFALVIPQGLGQPTGWNTGFMNLGKAGIDDLTYVTDLLDRCIKEMPIDKSRVYIAGHSNGAMMANALGTRLAGKVAAIGAFAGVIGIGDITGKNVIPKPTKPISVLHIHGREDNVVAYDKSSSAMLKGISAPRAIDWWAESLGIKGPAVVTNNDRVETTTYRNRDAEVCLISISGWQHSWPTNGLKMGNYTSPIDGATEMWKFFQRHKL